jgi:sugar phosphate permease
MPSESVDQNAERGSVTSDTFSAVQPSLKNRWTRVLPIVFVTYSLAYVVRANFGFGAAAGLAETLHITSNQWALLGALFFFGYFIFQIPGAAYAQKRSARKLIFFALLFWGILASLTGVIRNFWLLAVDRLLLGAAESFIFPGMMILLTKWFTRAERSRANTLLILGNPVTVLWMSAVTGYVIKAFGWQLAFIIEGLPSVAWAFVWYFVIRDRPEEVSWIATEAAVRLEAAIGREQTALPPVPNFAAALRNPNVVLLCIQYFFWCIGVYGFVLWLPVMIHQGSSEGIGAIGLLSAIPYIFAVLLMLLAGYYSDRSSKRSLFVWPFLLLAGAAFLGSYLTTDINFWVAFGFLVVAGATMYAPYGPFFAIIPELLPGNVAGEVIALVNSLGALGSFFGSWLVGFLQGHTGNSRAGYLLMSVSLTLAGLFTLMLRPVARSLPTTVHAEQS